MSSAPILFIHWAMVSVCAKETGIQTSAAPSLAIPYFVATSMNSTEDLSLRSVGSDDAIP